MTIYISTNMFIKTKFEEVFELMELVDIKNDVGIEIFPDWMNIEFIRSIEHYKEKIKQYKTTIHGPYFDVEHSAPKGTESYDFSMKEVVLTAELAREVGATDFVYHHNNKVVTRDSKREMMDISRGNLHELTPFLKQYGLNLLIENAGVKLKGNNLFTEEEFIEIALAEPNGILIDIGHVNANGWNLENVIQRLKDKIVSYHLHNNDGSQDNHNRINEGTLDLNSFEQLYKKHTPSANLILEYGYHMADRKEEVVADIKEIANRFL